MGYKLKNSQFPYPLNYLPSRGGLATTPFVAGNPFVEADSDNWYVLCLTPQEMVDLQSIVSIGATLLFENDYNVYIQKYQQLREYPNEIPEGSCMDLCQLILDCINDTEGLQEVIARYSLASPVNVLTIENQQALDAQIMSNQIGCDNDTVFGMCVGLTDLLNNLSEDLLEIIVSAPNTVARMGDVVEAIPGIGILPFDDILQVSEGFLDDVQQGYAAAYTVSLKNEIQCAFFCIAQDTCELTLLQVRDYLYIELAETLTFDNFGDFIESLLVLNVTGQATVWAIHLFIVELLIYGSSVFDLDFTKMFQLINAMFNDPDGDWAILCTNCAWESTWLDGNGTPTTDGWIITEGSYDAGNDRIIEAMVTASTYGSRCTYEFPVGYTGVLTEITMDWLIVNSGTDRWVHVQIFDDIGTLIDDTSQKEPSGSNTQLWSGSQAVLAGWEIRLEVNTSSVLPRDAWINKITVKGEGDNPF